MCWKGVGVELKWVKMLTAVVPVSLLCLWFSSLVIHLGTQWRPVWALAPAGRPGRHLEALKSWLPPDPVQAVVSTGEVNLQIKGLSISLSSLSLFQRRKSIINLFFQYIIWIKTWISEEGRGKLGHMWKTDVQKKVIKASWCKINAFISYLI